MVAGVDAATVHTWLLRDALVLGVTQLPRPAGVADAPEVTHQVPALAVAAALVGVALVDVVLAPVAVIAVGAVAQVGVVVDGTATAVGAVGVSADCLVAL